MLPPVVTNTHFSPQMETQGCIFCNCGYVSTRENVATEQDVLFFSEVAMDLLPDSLPSMFVLDQEAYLLPEGRILKKKVLRLLSFDRGTQPSRPVDCFLLSFDPNVLLAVYCLD